MSSLFSKAAGTITGFFDSLTGQSTGKQNKKMKKKAVVAKNHLEDQQIQVLSQEALGQLGAGDSDDKYKDAMRVAAKNAPETFKAIFEENPEGLEDVLDKDAFPKDSDFVDSAAAGEWANNLTVPEAKDLAFFFHKTYEFENEE